MFRIGDFSVEAGIKSAPCLQVYILNGAAPENPFRSRALFSRFHRWPHRVFHAIASARAASGMSQKKGQLLRVHWNALAVQDLVLNALDRFGDLHRQRNLLAGRHLDDDLHRCCTRDTEVDCPHPSVSQVVSQHFSVIQRHALKGEPLLVRWDAIAILDGMESSAKQGNVLEMKEL